MSTFRKYIIVVFLVVTGMTSSQQNPQYSQYIQNPMVINPAITGAEDYLDVTGAYRNQWSGFDGAPQTGTLTFNMPIGYPKNGQGTHQGVGGFLYTDKAGPISTSGLSGAYAFHLQVANDWYVSLGAFAGVSQFKFDDSDVVLIDNPNDVLIQSLSTTNFDMSAGVYVYSPYLFAGFSANQLFDNEIPYDFANGIITDTSGKINRNFNMLLGGRLNLTDDLQLVPSTLIKTTENAPIQWDLNAKLTYQQKFWVGASYRNEDAFVVLAGLRFLENFWAGYSYDFVTSNLGASQSGSHELVLSYRIPLRSKEKFCGCPKYSM